MPGRLIHVSPVIVDVVMTVDHVPEPGGAVLADSSQSLLGGGFNVMAAAARAGMRVVYGGAHGTGPNGELARAALRAEGVEVAHPPAPGSDTGSCVVLVDRSAERTFVTRLGAEIELSQAQLRSLEPAPGDTVYIVGYALLPGPHGEELAAWLGELPPETRLVFDPAPVVGQIDPELLDTVLARTDVFSPNAPEAAELTGGTDLERAAALLTGRIRPGGTVVPRDGAHGCLVAAAGAEPVRVPGIRVDAVDTNGAGDAHVGTFAAALTDGFDPVTAARRANAAAAFAVTRRGPAAAPTSSELDAFLAEHGGS